jgi:hypothetical protein
MAKSSWGSGDGRGKTMKRRSRRKSVRVDGGEQPEAPQSVAANGDHAATRSLG